MAKLTQQFVRSVTEPGSYQDGRGLFLRVTAKGYKYWILRYQLDGDRTDLILGSFPSVSLRDARLQADRHRGDIARGINPMEQRQQKKHTLRNQKPKITSFQVQATRYIQTHEPSWEPRHAKQWRQSLAKHALPILGGKCVSEISTEDVLEVLNPIWLVLPTTARRVRNRIELVLDAAKALGLRTGENPARWRGHLDKLLPRQKVQSSPFPAMPASDIPDFMHILDAVEGTAARALSVLILSHLRSSEVRGARWCEFDFDNKVWCIPAERMKAKRAHRVPLTDELIGEIKQQEGLHPVYVFPAPRGKSFLAGNALNRLMRSLGVDEYVPHGFRSSFRTWAAEETNFPREICEMALSHQLDSKVEAAYYRGDQLEKRRELSRLWCDLVLSRRNKTVGIQASG